MMRYEKKVILLSSTLAALLLVWAAGIVFSPERVAARSESIHLVAGKSADVASISIRGEGGSTIELAKSGAAWSLVDGAARFPAQASRISSFIDDLSAISRISVVARSKESWSGFQLDEAKAKRATLKDSTGKILADIYVGGYGPAGNEVYLRRAGSDLSYSAQSSISSYFGYGRSSWLDLKVLEGVKEADIQSVYLRSGLALDGKGKAPQNLDYSIVRDGQGWKTSFPGAVAAGQALDAEAVASLLRSIIGMQGEDYIASPPADAFSKIGASMSLALGTGTSLKIEIGSALGDDRYYARIAGKENVFELSSYSLRSMLKNVSDLLAKK